MDETIAVSSRHIVVELRDHVAGALGGCQGSVHANAETAKAVRIRWRNLYQGHVNRHRTALEKLLNFAQVDWSVISATIVDRLAHIRANEDCVMAEVGGHFRRDIRCTACLLY